MIKLLDWRNLEDLGEAELQPINLGMLILKEIAKWIVRMAEYLSDNPQFIVNGFLRSGITDAFDGDDEIGSDDEPKTQAI